MANQISQYCFQIMQDYSKTGRRLATQRLFRDFTLRHDGSQLGKSLANRATKYAKKIFGENSKRFLLIQQKNILENLAFHVLMDVPDIVTIRRHTHQH